MVILCFVALLFSLNGKQIQFDGLYYDERLNVTSQSPAGVELSYSLKEFDISDIEINGKVWDQIIIAEKLLPGAEGRPDVPNIFTCIALPQGAKASVKIVDYRTETFTGLDIAPAPRIPLETEAGLELTYPLSWIALNLQNGALNSNETDPVMISIDTNDLEVTKLIGCYPNPFNPETTISFQISDPAQVKLQADNIQQTQKMLLLK